MQDTKEKKPELVMNGRVIDGVIPSALSEDVFLKVVDGFSKYESLTKICKRAGISRMALRQWLSDPNPVDMVKELKEAIIEIQAAPQRQIFLKAQEIIMKRLTVPRKTVRRTRIISDTITTQEYNQIVSEFGEETAKSFQQVIEWRSATVAIQETEVDEEIKVVDLFRIWSYLREQLVYGSGENVVDDVVVVAVNHPDLSES